MDTTHRQWLQRPVREADRAAYDRHMVCSVPDATKGAGSDQPGAVATKAKGPTMTASPLLNTIYRDGKKTVRAVWIRYSTIFSCSTPLGVSSSIVRPEGSSTARLLLGRDYGAFPNVQCASFPRPEAVVDSWDRDHENERTLFEAADPRYGCSML